MDRASKSSVDRGLSVCLCWQLVLSAGPAEHAHAFCLPLMLENSFLASAPGHPAWRRVFTQLEHRRHYPVTALCVWSVMLKGLDRCCNLQDL